MKVDIKYFFSWKFLLKTENVFQVLLGSHTKQIYLVTGKIGSSSHSSSFLSSNNFPFSSSSASLPWEMMGMVYLNIKNNLIGVSLDTSWLKVFKSPYLRVNSPISHGLSLFIKMTSSPFKQNFI